jgi:hypothetical protein
VNSWTTFSPAPAVTIISNTLASPSVFTTLQAHQLQVGDKVTIAGNSVALCNGAGLVVASIPTAWTFTCTNVDAAAAGTGGTVVRTAVIHTKSTSEQWMRNFERAYCMLLVDTDNNYDYTIYGSEDPTLAFAAGTVLATAANQTATSQPKLISGTLCANFPYIGVSVKNVGGDVSTITAKLSCYDTH